MSRHAVLVVTFGSANVLARLVRVLDHPDIDIYVHVDRRTPIEPYRALAGETRHSRYRIIDRRRAPNWGSHHFVLAQLDLLAEAQEAGYDRYHLVSGADLPLLTGDEFVRFFDERPTFEYVGFSNRSHPDRLRYYYLLQPWITRGTWTGDRLRSIQTRLVGAQERIGVDRLRRFGPTEKGSTWYSITHGFATYALEHRRWIRTLTRFALVSDEAWPQTLLTRSPFADRRDPTRLDRADDDQALRLVDWSLMTASPRLWSADDIPTLLSSDCVFARKFDPDDIALLDGLASAVLTRPR